MNLVIVAKKGISAFQLQRELGMKSYKGAWRMLHLIRQAMSKEEYNDVFEAVVQDSIYDGDHHNDVMTTKPYESKTYKKSIVLTESKLRRIITESVRNLLNRLLY